MNHTPQIKKAIQFAARKHHGQLRREAEALPYVTHLFSVALLVAEAGGDDDAVTAALLHDTIEDTATTREEIVAAFSEHVAALVESVSEPQEREGKKLSWKERKQAYIDTLESAEEDSILIAVADKIDNIESKVEAFEREGPDFLDNWKQPSSEYFWYHGEVLRIAQGRLPAQALVSRLAEAHAKERQVFAGS
jgi:(p)ppGpp synthase/HD superfamily hydrolase